MALVLPPVPPVHVEVPRVEVHAAVEAAGHTAHPVVLDDTGVVLDVHLTAG